MIIILAVTALISVPILLNMIESARKSAFIDSAYGLIESAKLSYTESLMDGKNEITTYTYPFEELEFRGSKPNGGMIRIDEFGNTEIAIHNNRWCASKSKMDDKVTLIDYQIDYCLILDNSEDPMIVLNGESEIILKLGESYKELGAIGKTVSGTPLEYTIEIMKDGQVVDKIDTNLIGHYVITYQVSSNGKVVNTTRTIIIENSRKTMEEIMSESTQVMSNDPEHNLRYVGSDPNNYVIFNHELWRIIGLFDHQLKIIRDEPYSTSIEWDKEQKYGGHGNYGYNDWSVSTLQIELNTTFLNRIDSASKALIDQNYIWKLGGNNSYITYTREECYHREKGTETYADRPVEWLGAIGLIYPSDYGYATASKELYCDETISNWHDDCKSKDWLHDSSKRQWTITPDSTLESGVFTIDKTGSVARYGVTNVFSLKPVVYLKPDLEIQSGNGTKETPFLFFHESYTFNKNNTVKNN